MFPPDVILSSYRISDNNYLFILWTKVCGISLHYQRRLLCRVFQALPRAKSQALDRSNLPSTIIDKEEQSANILFTKSQTLSKHNFAECPALDTIAHSAATGDRYLCRVSEEDTWQRLVYVECTVKILGKECVC